ncbi:MAG TPA: transporter substrate-binding domain-containing protein [Anaeromyxobacter sp.]
MRPNLSIQMGGLAAALVVLGGGTPAVAQGVPPPPRVDPAAAGTLTSAAPPASAPAAADPEAASTAALPPIKGPLRVATSGSYLALHERTAAGWMGLEPELAFALGKRLGRGVVFVDPGGRGRTPLEAVASGAADVALSAITPSEEHARDVDFTAPYASVPVLLATRDAQSPPDLAALRGRRVAVASALAARLGELGAELVPYPDLGAAVRAAKVDGSLLVAGDAPRLRVLAARHGLRILPLAVGAMPVAMAVPRGDREKVGEQLAALATEIAALQARWLPVLDTYVAISAGLDFACALTATGKVHCFSIAETRSLRGSRRAGGSSTSPLASVPSGEFVAVAAGWGHACALDRAGIATCWGSNRQGQCAVPPRVAFRSIAAGVHHTCGLTVDGAAVCWGSNSDGQATPPKGTFTRLAAGGHLACALGADGRARCWGRTWPLGESPAVAFQDLAVSEDFACGLEGSGRVQCWGRSVAAPTAPLAVPPVRFRSIAAGGGAVCGLAVDEGLVCWPGRWDVPGDPELTAVSVYDERGGGLTPRGRVALFDKEGRGLAKLVVAAAGDVEFVSEGELVREPGAHLAICDRKGWTPIGSLVDGAIVEGGGIDPTPVWYDARSYLRRPATPCGEPLWVVTAPIAPVRDRKPGSKVVDGGWTRTTLQWVQLEDGSRLGLTQLTFDPGKAKADPKALKCGGYVVDWEPRHGSAQHLDLTDCPGD